MRYITIEQSKDLVGIVSNCKCDCGDTYKIEAINLYGNTEEVIVCDTCHELAPFLEQY